MDAPLDPAFDAADGATTADANGAGGAGARATGGAAASVGRNPFHPCNRPRNAIGPRSSLTGKSPPASGSRGTGAALGIGVEALADERDFSSVWARPSAFRMAACRSPSGSRMAASFASSATVMDKRKRTDARGAKQGPPPIVREGRKSALRSSATAVGLSPLEAQKRPTCSGELRAAAAPGAAGDIDRPVWYKSNCLRKSRAEGRAGAVWCPHFRSPSDQDGSGSGALERAE